jgi:opacity protein-like surface antigen
MAYAVRAVFLLAATSAVAVPVSAQAVPKRTPEQIKASYEAHKGEFDYLLGDWQFTSVSKEFGKGGGFWSAVRLAEGADILDEYRVAGDQGETYYASSTVRAYNAVLERWELVSADRGTGLQNFGTAHRVGEEVHIEQKFGVMSQKPSLWRIRYYDIHPDRFSWAAERSTDDGKTWEKDFLRIDARRIGPPRNLEPLAPVRKP